MERHLGKRTQQWLIFSLTRHCSGQGWSHSPQAGIWPWQLPGVGGPLAGLPWPSHLVPGPDALPSAAPGSAPLHGTPGCWDQNSPEAGAGQPPAGGVPGPLIKGRGQLSRARCGSCTATMPGLSLEGLAQAGVTELAELHQELVAFRGAAEGQLEQALQRVQALAQALQTLEQEHLELRAELGRLGRRLDLLAPGLQAPPGEDISTLFLEAQDPCAHFEGTEEPSGPVAHPPTFSSTRPQMVLHLSRSNSSVSVGSLAPWQGEGRGSPAPGALGGVHSPGTRRDCGSGARGHSTVGICHSLGSLWQGCAPTCSSFPVCQVRGCRQLSCPHHTPGTGGGMGTCGQCQLLLTAVPWISYWATGCRMGPGVCMAALAPLCHPCCL